MTRTRGLAGLAQDALEEIATEISGFRGIDLAAAYDVLGRLPAVQRLDAAALVPTNAEAVRRVRRAVRTQPVPHRMMACVIACTLSIDIFRLVLDAQDGVIGAVAALT